MTPVQAGQWVRFFRRRFTLLPDRDDLSDRWLALVEGHTVTGFRAHDARLVAAMQSYGVTELQTFNAGHFRALPVTVLDPLWYDRSLGSFCILTSYVLSPHRAPSRPSAPRALVVFPDPRP
ncbi:MAG TPA: hypothetical protein VFW94_05705 [Candidatus Acidoferrales bacterium]|nr:hypothetical protein [Candidatus Acidoferrales bacterium]